MADCLSDGSRYLRNPDEPLACSARLKGHNRPMLRLTRAPDLTTATLWVDALNTEGISASVQRQYLAGVAGELPPDQCTPEVWIAHPEQEARARTLLHHLQHVPQRQWWCRCGEFVEGGFEQCWRCGAWMPG